MQDQSGVRAERGFTLVELMVTITVGAILAAIAVPTYTAQVRKSRRSEARNAVLDAAAREERYFATNNKYTIAPADLGYTAFPADVGSGQNYTLNVTCTAKATDPCVDYTATASPKGKQTDDTLCKAFVVDNTGKQSVTGTSSADTTLPCWN